MTLQVGSSAAVFAQTVANVYAGRACHCRVFIATGMAGTRCVSCDSSCRCCQRRRSSICLKMAAQTSGELSQVLLLGSQGFCRMLESARQTVQTLGMSLLLMPGETLDAVGE